ncbi:MAG: GIY-YIG nuclease family protein [Clostridiales bacterium]|nr:GIY-YIG nuclease family protein [Clostridiales bacterium]
MKANTFYVYIMSNQYNNVLYIGVTNNLERRVNEHKSGLIEGFTSKYHVHKLVYYESCHDVRDAITREKQLKHWGRDKKVALIETLNPEWKDLGG